MMAREQKHFIVRKGLHVAYTSKKIFDKYKMFKHNKILQQY